MFLRFDILKNISNYLFCLTRELHREKEGLKTGCIVLVVSSTRQQCTVDKYGGSDCHI